MHVVELAHDYDAAPGKVWALATDLDALAEVCAPLVTFEGLPPGRCEVGVYEVDVRLFGRLPPQPYRMEVLEMDDDAMRLRSSEVGTGVKTWNHTLEVVPTPGGCQLRDRIEIEAKQPFLTPVFAWWATKFYRHRHAPRQRMLQRMQAA